MFVIDISKKISPQEPPAGCRLQAKCLAPYGPHIVSNIGEAVSRTAEYPSLSARRGYILPQSGISDSVTIYHPSTS